VVKPDSGFLSSKFLLCIRAVLKSEPPQNAAVSLAALHGRRAESRRRQRSATPAAAAAAAARRHG